MCFRIFFLLEAEKEAAKLGMQIRFSMRYPEEAIPGLKKMRYYETRVEIVCFFY